MLRLKQYFCRHQWDAIAKHRSANESLYQCKRCAVFFIFHHGLFIGYKCKTPNIGGWEYFEQAQQGGEETP
jgi:hypothetical protein